MSKTVIRVSNLGKKYRLGATLSPDTLRDHIMHAAGRLLGRNGTRKTAAGDFWALKDVSFEVRQGEVLGVIGPNGAGKSTLLKILTKITEPTEGEVRIKGRVASLLEVGTGFHPELSGRENIFMNGAILGMTQREIKARFDEIVDFSGVEKFLDTPMKRYSDGMRVRLGFAIAAHLDPEILLVDEVLAVGDAEFQKKCLGKMQEVSRGGRTVLFVSHNMMAVEVLCSSAILLVDGAVVSKGETDRTIARYAATDVAGSGALWQRDSATQSSGLHFQTIEAELCGEQPEHRLCLRLVLNSHGVHPPAFLAIDIFDVFGTWLMQAIPTVAPFIRDSTTPQEVRVVVDLPPLIPDEYRVGAWVGTDFSNTLDAVPGVVSFVVRQSPTPGRSFPHYRKRGYCVPNSRVVSAGTAN